VDDSLPITITKAEALVLFELLSGFLDQPNIAIRNGAERATLWSLQAALEKALAEPFSEDYARLVDEARRIVVAKWGSIPDPPPT
jgi:hypothetical protein